MIKIKKISNIVNHRLLLMLLLLTACIVEANAQNKFNDLRANIHSKKKVYDESDNDRHGTLYAYYLTPRIGDRTSAFIDTLRLNFYERSWVNRRSIIGSFTGSYASPYQSMVYFDRPQDQWGDYYFTNIFDDLIHRGKDMRWFDTKIPYSRLSYVKTGSSEEAEENFHTLFSLNIGPKLNIGGQFDYDNANGVYARTRSKNISYRIYGSYIGDKYNAYLSIGNTNVVNQESGGLLDDKYITNPDDFTNGRRTLRPKDIPVKFNRLWNRVVYGSMRLNQKYALGFYKTDSIKVGDSIRIGKHLVPVTRFFHDFLYQHGRRHLLSQDGNIPKLYPNPVISRPTNAPYYPDDRFSLVKISNTVGVELLEGFHKWAKMGIAAYASFDYKKYNIPILGSDSTNLNTTEKTTYIGGRLSSNSFKHFKYYISAELGVLGDQIGELKANGKITTTVKIKQKTTSLTLTMGIRNIPPNYLLNHYKGSLYQWNRSLKMSQSLRLGGDLDASIIGSHLYGNVETIQNPIYVGSDGTPQQSSSNLRVISAGIEQKLGYGFLHWENNVVWQHSSNTSIAPLPSLAAFSNLYILTTVAKVMALQIGVDARWHTSYYAPYYDPITMLFVPQKEIKLGGKTPFMTAYISAHLRRARFYVSYYNLSDLIFKPNDFTVPHYPIYPSRIRAGIIIDLEN